MKANRLKHFPSIHGKIAYILTSPIVLLLSGFGPGYDLEIEQSISNRRAAEISADLINHRNLFKVLPSLLERSYLGKWSY